jgi:hypothetical protein
MLFSVRDDLGLPCGAGANHPDGRAANAERRRQ